MTGIGEGKAARMAQHARGVLKSKLASALAVYLRHGCSAAYATGGYY
jgi:hypothetical protein